MSGGAFDYVQYRINDVVEDIETVLQKNRKTILENWNELSSDEKECCSHYDEPWSDKDHPFWIEDEAEKIADKTFNIRKPGNWKSANGTLDGVLFNDLTTDQKKKWNEVRNAEIQKIIDERNNSFIGNSYSDETVIKIREMLSTIRKAAIFLNRIDWLFSGDDGEDNFSIRTDEDIEEAGLEKQ